MGTRQSAVAAQLIDKEHAESALLNGLPSTAHDRAILVIEAQERLIREAHAQGKSLYAIATALADAAKFQFRLRGWVEAIREVCPDLKPRGGVGAKKGRKTSGSQRRRKTPKKRR